MGSCWAGAGGVLLPWAQLGPHPCPTLSLVSPGPELWFRFSRGLAAALLGRGGGRWNSDVEEKSGIRGGCRGDTEQCLVQGSPPTPVLPPHLPCLLRAGGPSSEQGDPASPSRARRLVPVSAVVPFKFHPPGRCLLSSALLFVGL